MRSLKSFIAPMAVAAVLGLGFGFGTSQTAQAAPNTCRSDCAAEFQACLAEGSYPGFYRCRTYFSACLNACG